MLNFHACSPKMSPICDAEQQGASERGALCLFGSRPSFWSSCSEINKKTLLVFVNVIGSYHLNSHHISEMLCPVLCSQGHCVAEQW